MFEKLTKPLFIVLFSISTSTMALESTAIFGGGCFWCVEADFDKVPGVLKTVSGFDGGHIHNPSYQKVSAGTTNYVEVVKVTFDPRVVSYDQLLAYYWRHIDPTAENSQFCDKGRQYRSVIFYLNEKQKKIALDSKKSIQNKLKPVYTEILPSTTFYPAEDYHQNYYKKNPLRYKYYRYRCGRDQRLKEVWDK